MANKNAFDVAILGGGLAGLTLARHLMLHTQARVLLVEKRTSLPPKNQKVGESTVQLGGYYLSKVLDLEEELLKNHFMKYNLRFHWKTQNGNNFEDYSQAYIRHFSNIASYQVNRNELERYLLNDLRSNTRCEVVLGCAPQVQLGPPHRLQLGDQRIEQVAWVVDTTGRQAFLSRGFDNAAPSPTEHAASFAWVEGLVDFDKLNTLSPAENRRKPARRQTGHLPFWLATNHFMGEGFWFWLIPLQGITSLGLVFDKNILNLEMVNTPEKLLQWAAKQFPLFKKDFDNRRILGGTCLKDTGIGRKQMIHAQNWAISGDAGRFLDPLYSPGTDFIAIQNSLIVQAIESPRNELSKFCLLAESLSKAYFDAFTPSFRTSYNALGDQESFILKYTWELSVYFAFYVFPFINDLTTRSTFTLPFLQRFSELGALNHQIHHFLSDFFIWKKTANSGPAKPYFHELMSLAPLAHAEKLFYEVGVTESKALEKLESTLDELKVFAQFILCYMTARVLGDQTLVKRAAFVKAIDPKKWKFDLAAFSALAKKCGSDKSPHAWPFDFDCLDVFWNPSGNRKAA
ncbi:MAG: tryptophan 7-halogenase [Bdellovibrionales bacterium]|nr:tryptophan 7-halogenase [Bdellovibrionales bacterium]